MIISVGLRLSIQLMLNDLNIHSFLMMLIEGTQLLVAFILINFIFKT